MSQVHVALVCPDDGLRMAAAAAFDEAPAEWDVALYKEVPQGADVVVSVGCELPNAVGFDAARPALVLEEVERRLMEANHKRILVVGASGGCGATSVAIHLAAEASSHTCLIGPREATGLSHRLGLEQTANATPVPVPGGFKVMTVHGGALRQVVGELAAGFESVIVDPGSALVPSLARDAHACVLVLAPTVPSALAATELLADFPEPRWALVTNRVGPGGETSRAELQVILERRICLELPCSRGLRDAEGESRLVSALSPWRRKVARLAQALELT